ncbi:glycoside hydrolase family 35 protein [Vagococcus sp. JNUCC 83]
MSTFEISEDFLLDGQPFKILSGAIHYFRVHPDDWYHSLYNLKALGFNTVETYVSWNLHEPEKGNVRFDGILDIERFLSIAQDLGLYAIVRPSPYICAEWEFGGFPAWLLQDKAMKIRRSDTNYLQHVADYYDELLPRLAKHQLVNNGNVLMFQIENEYGSYGEDKEYLSALKQMMLDRGIVMPLFTSDGAWQATLEAGSMIEEGILPTGNFGSKAKENFDKLQAFFDKYNKTFPLMCMEFWDGWFNRWGDNVIRRDPEELRDAVKEAIEIGSINLYMFHGGTNFGFMNGCSARGQIDLPQVTSYDYDAILDEQGNPTKKYYLIQELIQEMFPDNKTSKPLIKESMAKKSVPLSDKVSLFSTLDTLATKTQSKYPLTMDELNQNTGYVLYRTNVLKDKDEEYYRVIDGRDRLHFYLNETLMATQYQQEIGDNITVPLVEESNQLDILMENMGRVNYGHKLFADTQRKGIRTGVMSDLHFITEWEHYPLSFETSEGIDFSGEWLENQAAFYQYNVNIAEVCDTYIDMTGFGKGIVLVNGVNIGRFWSKGPYMTLYIPSGLLQEGDNEFIVFETEGQYQEHINLVEKPIVKTIEEEL